MTLRPVQSQDLLYGAFALINIPVHVVPGRVRFDRSLILYQTTEREKEASWRAGQHSPYTVLVNPMST